MSGKERKPCKKALEEIKDPDECSCFVKSRNTETCNKLHPSPLAHPLRYYEFTQDEIKVLEECDRESFYKRCLPLSAAFATLTYAAVKYELMCPNIHFGVWPKVLTSALLGHCLGRLSYISACDKKIREELTGNSHLGNTMRKYHADRNAPPKCKPKK